jgi:hypothetical protein
LEQPAGHHHVLQKVDHLVLVGEIGVEGNGGRQGEDSQRKRSRTHAVTENEKQSPAELDGHGHRVGKRRERKSGGVDHRRGRTCRMPVPALITCTSPASVRPMFPMLSR